MKVETEEPSMSSYSTPPIDNTRCFSRAPFFRQCALFFQVLGKSRFRKRMIWLEILFPILFLVFDILFAVKIHPTSKDIKDPPTDLIIPFNLIPGPAPRYGAIPNTTDAEEFLQKVAAANVVPTVLAEDEIRLFPNWDEYTQWTEAHKETGDIFYLFEKNKTANPLADKAVRISTNGLTFGSIAFLIGTLATTETPPISVTSFPQPVQPRVFFNFTEFPSKPRRQPEFGNSFNVIVFACVLFISGLLCSATYYGEMTDKGIRDLLTFYGLSEAAYYFCWYVIIFAFEFVPSIFFIINIAICCDVDFHLLLVYYLLTCSCLTSFCLVFVSLWPVEKMGQIVGFGILLSYFIFNFWGNSVFIYAEGHWIEKGILSIFPNAVCSYALTHLATAEVRHWSEISGPKSYPVRIGFVYLAVETVVYFLIYLLIDYVKPRKWLPAKRLWKKFPRLEDRGGITVDNLTKIYQKDSLALNHISLQIEKNEILAIVGSNGAGKSSLIQLLSGCMRASSGSVYYRSTDILRDLEAIHEVSGLCPQDNICADMLTPPEWIQIICGLRNQPDFDYTGIFAALGLESQLKSRICDLSGGNKRKVILAAALVCNPAFVFLDECTAGVDFTSRTRIWSLIASLKETTIVMATHTLEECEKIADRIMLLQNGDIENIATPNEMRVHYHCGYLLDLDIQYKSQLEKVLEDCGFANSLERRENSAIKIEESEDRICAVLPSDKHELLAGMLSRLDFPYLLTIQSLEEKIFEYIQKSEQNNNLKGDDQEDKDNQAP